MIPASSNRLLLAILALGLAIGIVRLVQVPPEFGKGQTDNYWPMANSLLDGQGLRLCYPLYFPTCSEENNVTAMREPLPVLLFAGVAAITGRSLQAALILQLIAHLIIALLTYRWVRRLSDERNGLVAALLWVLYLPALQTAPQLSGDLLGAAFFMGAALQVYHACGTGTMRAWALSGVLLGLAVLCRSVLLVTVLPWGLMALRSRKQDGGWLAIMRPAMVFGVCTVLVLSPWIVRNERVFHRFWPGTSMNGYNLFRNSYQIKDHQPVHYVGPNEAQQVMNDMMARRTDLRGDENEAEMDRVYMEEARSALAANPVGYVKLSLYRFIPLWTNWGVPEQYDRPITLFDHAMLWEQVVLLVFLLIGWWHTRDRSTLWLLTIALQVMAYMAVVGQIRYLLPVMPLVIGLAVVGARRLLPGQAVPGQV